MHPTRAQLNGNPHFGANEGAQNEALAIVTKICAMIGVIQNVFLTLARLF
jgi:hypothetical protein